MPSETIEPSDDGYLVHLQTTMTAAEAEEVGRRRLRDASEITHAAAWGLLLLARLERQAPSGAEETEDRQAELRGLIRALEQRILPRLEGLRDAAVRWHRDLDGSHGQLAEAMGVPRSTAQTRLGALLEREVSDGERWARGQ
ncbi:hypothetical protein [Sphaerisporangium siamense]|uniref:Uncharacterized protein n=1 Tax=Sphaerisporangium siamense TaxID=795645 RepID=A0A7W7DFY9_9ACTN|nr:hypothetical protein [Sphaerisporangium siamense]MBB4706154.1 hypothetical protein [Sphaerisporangium siamense]